jgi:predicted DNA-binding protein
LRHNEQQTQLGARIPADLKAILSKYCSSRGIKLNYFVTEAIRDKLLEMIEDSEDLKIAQERLKNADFVSLEELKKYLKKRGIKTDV